MTGTWRFRLSSRPSRCRSDAAQQGVYLFLQLTDNNDGTVQWAYSGGYIAVNHFVGFSLLLMWNRGNMTDWGGSQNSLLAVDIELKDLLEGDKLTEISSFQYRALRIGTSAAAVDFLLREMCPYKLLITGARQIVQVTASNEVAFLCGEHSMNNIKLIESAECNCALLVDENGQIAAIGDDDELTALADKNGCKNRLSANGGVLLPGLVDAHTHAVFAGDRVHEFAMKLAGATYLEVQKAGGGILFTMNKTREASEEELLATFEKHLLNFMRNGTTTVEAKSGYGLNTESELKMLHVIDMAADYVPIEVVGTFCGGHAVPKDSDEETQTNMIIGEMIPEITKEKREGRLKSVENIDVFCEVGNFGVETTKRILEAGKNAGLEITFHAEELNRIGGAEMGAAINARSMSHLEQISDEAINAMAKSGTAAVLLPTTAFTLRLKPPPARKMIEQGVIVALGSDFNPNAYCLSMPMVMHLACVNMKMSMAEALVAATINAAYALGRGKTHGALAVGRRGDVLIIDQPKWEHLIYQFGCHNTIIKHVIKSGDVVYSRNDPS